ncbi:hypothetical protein OK074_2422 [Actinobacteria bacterium OK074]|nr:hypothetical protein OK074_2422 [Actinobacteria bacterium OK074]
MSNGAVSHHRWRWARLTCAGALALGALSVAPAAPVAATTGGTDRTETPVASTSPVTGVVETEVSLRIPLPASAGPHPAACDRLSYLRYRSASGPDDSADADRILVAQPGILEGAGAFDSVARDTVTAAATQGRHIEFWALDRRSNCLEDHTGTASGDVAKAVGYYYGGERVQGRTFGGFLTSDRTGWLANVGLEQTVRDEYDLLTAELPDQQLRKRKVLCGGHSLGGVITGAFATWDFDGDPATTADAGFNQCAGYFALDTTISTSLDDLNGTSGSGSSGNSAAGSGSSVNSASGGGSSANWASGTSSAVNSASGTSSSVTSPTVSESSNVLTNGTLLPKGTVPDVGIGYDAVLAALRTGLLPRFLALPVVLNPETMNLLALGGLAARNAPDAQSELLSTVPNNLNIEATGRTLFSKDAGTFASGSPSIRDFRLTNAAVLGAFMDDNSAPLAFLQTSVGFFDSPDGGRIVDKNFPVSNDIQGQPALFGTQLKAIPDQPDGPLYTWRDYDRVGAADDPGYRSANGEPFTSAGEEVSDIGELARSLSEQPLDFTEQYFPTRLVTDIELVDEPQLAGRLVHPEGLTANPTITFIAGDGILSGHVPQDKNPVVVPGYQHLDVLTAAPKQNGGGQEQVSVRLAEFAAKPADS